MASPWEERVGTWVFASDTVLGVCGGEGESVIFTC